MSDKFFIPNILLSGSQMNSIVCFNCFAVLLSHLRQASGVVNTVDGPGGAGRTTVKLIKLTKALNRNNNNNITIIITKENLE